MTKAELLANIKSNMKISVTSFDTVLNQMIDECIKDIRESMDVDSLEAMTDVELLGRCCSLRNNQNIYKGKIWRAE